MRQSKKERNKPSIPRLVTISRGVEAPHLEPENLEHIPFWQTLGGALDVLISLKACAWTSVTYWTTVRGSIDIGCNLFLDASPGGLRGLVEIKS